MARQRRFLSSELRAQAVRACHDAQRNHDGELRGVFADKRSRGNAVQTKPLPPSSSPEADDNPNRDEWLFDYFDRVVVISLEGAKERMRRLMMHIGKMNWPFRTPELRRAVQGSVVGCPGWWKAGAAAWGCHQSHVRAIEDAMMDRVRRLLVLEDDVFFVDGFRERVEAYLSSLPADWHQIYLGGQHLSAHQNPPRAVNPEVVKPYNVNRTHAYALQGDGLARAYRWLTDYVQHAQNPAHHVDHRFGEWHKSRQMRVYAPTRWLAGQTEGHSTIKGKVLPKRIWSTSVKASQAPFVAVVGLHRSGSSCLAGVLHALGLFMGDHLQGQQYEARELASLCEQAYPFPNRVRAVSTKHLQRTLGTYVNRCKATASIAGTFAGGKYPHLCAMLPLLESVCGASLRVIHISRPIEESIASLQTRSRSATGWLKASDERVEELQRWLWEEKERGLRSLNHITIFYHDLLDRPLEQVQRVIEYLGITPSNEQIELAIRRVRPERAKHRKATVSIAEGDCHA